MLSIEKVDTQNASQVRRFVSIPYRLYANCPQWVPALFVDANMQLNRRKHPFYEHSDADFFVALRDGRPVGRIAALENRRYNENHNTRQAQFYLFECEDEPEVAAALFTQVDEWARARNLDTVVGPKGFGALDGYGLLVDGYEHRQMMTMMNYNYPYYVKLVESAGYSMAVDFISCRLDIDTFKLPERVHSIARRAMERSNLNVLRFRTKREVIAWAPKLGKAYNEAFKNNWEYYPLTQREIDFLMENVLMLVNPRLVKLIVHDEDVVGFLLAFPDVSGALQRSHGRLFPFAIPDLLLDMRRTRWVALNGAGILSEYQGRGGNALLYSEMEKTIREFGFHDADLTQVADTAIQMRRDLINLGGVPYKTHRVFSKRLV
ncbi:MAG: hypothetical protein M1434_02195 [Chloroflexi bacterium]|nr:hypothetical protein [Chloroflexota bacterium]MCL5273540.1 hypothetical protein [Chloroflexota bacterium]